MIDSLQLSISRLSKRFGRNLVLDNLKFDIASHECVLLTGENGAGKSTLLRVIAGLEKPDHCEISINAAPTGSWRKLRKQLLKSVMYLHQQPYMLSGSLRRNLEYVAQLNPAIVDQESSVSRALEWGGLEALQYQNASSLSGGQKQRVALSRARLRNPQILLLDEPTANLDTESRERTMQMLYEFRESGTAIVIVSHDPEVFSDLMTRQIHLHDRQIDPEETSASEVVDLDKVRQSQQQ
jgi:tungstate transport system ATP-binding protein